MIASNPDELKNELYGIFNKVNGAIKDTSPYGNEGKATLASLIHAAAETAEAIIILEHKQSPKPAKASP